MNFLIVHLQLLHDISTNVKIDSINERHMKDNCATLQLISLACVTSINLNIIR